VTISSDPTLLCEIEMTILLCHTSGDTQPMYEWSTNTSSIAGQTSKIMVRATHKPVEYHCKVTDKATGRYGQASINIAVDGELICARQ